MKYIDAFRIAFAMWLDERMFGELRGVRHACRQIALLSKRGRRAAFGGFLIPMSYWRMRSITNLAPHFVRVNDSSLIFSPNKRYVA